MPEIHVLPPQLADMIAAGEVVDQPASVVKELLENAFDAGAKNVSVEIRGGGTAMIRVRDDGSGMSPEDAGVAFLRHATSKLHDADGLSRIQTMGFRGEALAAISAVSRIELLTRRQNTDEGVRVTLEAGEIQELGPAGCPAGTRMTVCDLFFNTPARRKFLKTDRAEGAACVSAALRSALGRPDVSVRCVRDGTELFFSPGDGRIESAAYSMLGRDVVMSMLPCRCKDTDIQVEGLVSSPTASHGSRSRQYFFVNGRPVNSLCLQTALEQAYHNSLMHGRFPACILYVTLSPGAIDVNVHPAKTEVKFSAEKTVFDAVFSAVAGALASRETPHAAHTPRTAPAGEPPRAASPRPAPSRPRVSPASPTAAPRFAPETAPAQPTASVPAPGPAFRPRPDPAKSGERPAPTAGVQEERAQRPAPARSTHAGSDSAPTLHTSFVPPRLIGEAFGTYIVAECGTQLLLIDKHAAHERMIFDELRSGNRQIMSQQLLEPVTLSGPDAVLLLANAPLLERMGIVVEPFGEDALVARALPADTDPGDGRALLEACAADLRKGASPELQQDAVLRTVACKAAIKAGQSSDPQELMRLVRAVTSGKVRFCPHGRPVSVVLSREQLDKRFRRIL